MNTATPHSRIKVIPADPSKVPPVFWALVGYIVMEYVRPQFFVPAIGYARPGLLLGTILIVYSVTKGMKAVQSSKIVQIIIALTVFIALWVPFALNNFHAFNTAKGMFLHTFALVVPTIALATTRHTFRILIFFVIAISTYISLFSLTHAGVGPGSFISDENDVALFILTGLPFSYYLTQSPNISKGQKSILYLCFFVMVLGIIATSSRGGFVGLAAVIGFMIWYSKSRIRTLITIVVVSGLVLPFVPDSYYAEVQSIGDDDDGTRLDRFHSWEMGWYMYLDNPVLGVGPSNYAWRVPEYEMQIPASERTSAWLHGGRVAHSLYFTLLPELGSVGTYLYIWLIFLIVRACTRIRKSPAQQNSYSLDHKLYAQAIVASVVGFLISGAFITVLYYPELWFLAALTAALLNLNQNESLSEAQKQGDT